MRRSFAASVLSVVLCAAAGVAATPAIDANRILQHIKFLASDELQGRGNGSPGLERAADYVAAQFKSAGLQPAGADGGWFQPFDITVGLTVGSGNALTMRTPDQSVRFSLSESYYPLAVSPDDDTVVLKDLQVVFAGYGISAPKFGYDDYAGQDVTGKAVLIFSHEPQETRADSRLNGARPLIESTLYNKASAARRNGARALIVVSDPSHRVDDANYKGFAFEPDADDRGLPVLRLRRDDMAPLLRALDLARSAAAIDVDLIPRSRLLPGVAVDYAQNLSTRRRTIRNVVGILRGSSDDHDDEAVVLGGHYDHVGLGGRFSSAPERTGEIHNGADDNASGIAALIEIARSAAGDRRRFPRSLVFIAFAGEERGLLGSAHYTNNPAIPLADTVAMVNLDMIGRSQGRLEVGGLSTAAPALRDDLHGAAKAVGIDVRPGGPGAGRSDDSSFIDRRVPAFHFFTGFHDDYHRPTDDWQRVDGPGTARVAALALELAARIANRESRPEFASR